MSPNSTSCTFPSSFEGLESALVIPVDTRTKADTTIVVLDHVSGVAYTGWLTFKPYR